MIHVLKITAVCLALAFISCSERKPSSGESFEIIGNIEHVDPLLDSIVARDAKIEILSENHEWTEGPVWVPELNALLFSDIPPNAIYAWRKDNPVGIWLKPSGYTKDSPREGESGSNGLFLNNEGKLVLAQHGDRRISELLSPWENPAPDFRSLAETYNGKRFNSPNDLVVKSDGTIYFTDPPYGLEEGENDPEKELDFQGVFKLDKGGEVTLLVDSLSRPNGIILSPDESILYVANSSKRQPYIMAYNLNPEGGITNGSVFYRSWGDGLAVDKKGNLYVAGPDDGVMILSSDGKYLGTIHTTQKTSNCTFGEQGNTLFITADMYLLRVNLKAKGSRF